MKTLLDYGFRLFVVCGIASLAIAALYDGARENIAKNAQKDLEDALAAVLGTSEGIAETVEGSGVYRVENDGEVLYAAEGGSIGYSSTVEVVLSAKKVGDVLTVVAMRIKSQQETPGLGTVIAEAESDETLWSWIGSLLSSEEFTEEKPPRYGFLDRFVDKNDATLKLTGDAAEAERGEAVLAISGATISSNASLKAARMALARIQAEVDAGR